ncbi:MAG: hypothetical protein ACOX9C_02235 [Kiritimatiellia bacterium]|jgi:hypothetical protein
MRTHGSNATTAALSAVLMGIACASAMGAVFEYQHVPDRTSPLDQGWGYIGELYPIASHETLRHSCLQIEDHSTTKYGPLYIKQCINDGQDYKNYPNFYYPFEARLLFKITECQVPSPDAPLAYLYVCNAQARRINGVDVTVGREITVGMSLTDEGTKFGFVNTNKVFFGSTYVSTNSDFIDLHLKKETGSNAPLKIYVDGQYTGITVGAMTNEFALAGSIAARQFRFGFMSHREATGVIQVVGCTAAANYDNTTSYTAPPINRWPAATVVMIR